MQLTTTTTKFAPTNTADLAAKVAEIQAKQSADEIDTARRLRVHVLCIAVGIAVTFGLSFVDLSVVFHFAGVAAGLPAVWQEILDRRHNW